MREFSTPMMRQYAEIKKDYDDCLLFFRLGDFYELFLEDAVVGARALGIVLTQRPRGKDGHIPMAGIPYHSAESYLAKLTKAGYKVAICEQVSEPNSKGIVEREVVRIVTPGTIMDSKSLNQKEHNYLISFSFGKKYIGIARADLSTGDFSTTQILKNKESKQVLASELTRFMPRECVLSEVDYANPKILTFLSQFPKLNIYPLHAWGEWTQDADKSLAKHFKLKTLAGLGLDSWPEAQIASAGLLGYLNHTQKNQISHIKTLCKYSLDDFLDLDSATIRNLEIFTTLRDACETGSLIRVMDKTKTPMAGRLLREWIARPLTKLELINNRLSAVEELLQNKLLRDQLQDELKTIYDIERIVSRLAVGVGNGADLVNLSVSLTQVLKIKEQLTSCKSQLTKNLVKEIDETLEVVIKIINERIKDDPAIDTKKGGIIRTGFNAQLDKLRAQVGGDKTWITQLEEKERARTKISSLKIKFNKVFGYYIEITNANLKLAPADYIRKQTMVNGERFITAQLKEYEESILTAEDKINTLEYQLFLNTVEDVLKYTKIIQTATAQIATLDCILGLAELAQNAHYTRPELNDDGIINIKDGRHPVVEMVLGDVAFVPNDCDLDNNKNQLLLITGPNMAGKSVFMRQVAVITLMAHIGSFVPATSANISLVDKIFVRSGAADVISQGLSTFMVEMAETAYILNNATNKSLIIMDEIGRGTSTYDGISIAWAIAEYLVTNNNANAKTLFATHYHELQELEKQYPEKIQNYQVRVEERDGELIFLHKVFAGGASHSYGVAVAKLAGIPELVTGSALKMLKNLEERDFSKSEYKVDKINSSKTPQSLLASETAARPNVEHPLIAKIKELDVNNMTPLEALKFLDDLKLEV